MGQALARLGRPFRALAGWFIQTLGPCPRLTSAAPLVLQLICNGIELSFAGSVPERFPATGEEAADPLNWRIALRMPLIDQGYADLTI